MGVYGSGAYGAGAYGIGGPAVAIQIPHAPNIILGVPQSFVTVPRVYKSDIYQTKLEDITPSRPISFVSSYNEDFSTKRQASFEVVFPDELKSYEDFIVLEAEMADVNGKRTAFHCGHFLIMGRDETITNSSKTGLLEGRDLTWLIQQMTMDRRVTTPVGADPGEAARNYLISLGIPRRLLNIDNAGVTLTREITSLPGENWLSYLTDLLYAAGMYQPWVHYDGRVTSKKQEDVSTKTCSGDYRMSTGASITPPVNRRPDLTRFRNRITVRKEVPGEDLISYTATVTDRGSPAHPEELQRRMGGDAPIILGQVYDEHELESVNEARILAKARLSEHLTFLDRLNLTTRIDTALCGHRTVWVDIAHGGTTHYKGRWLQRTWEVRTQGAAMLVSRELTKTTAWE